MSKLTVQFFISLFLWSLSSILIPSVYAAVLINELMPNPSTGDDWIELYKSDSDETDISGWQIEDSTGVVKIFSDGTKFASGSSYFQVLISNRLNKDGDNIKFKDKNNALIDEKSYNQDPGSDVSIGRYPDGSSNWGKLISTSPNTANSTFVPSPTPTPTSTPVPTSVPTSSPTNTGVPASTPTTKPIFTPTIYISPTIKKVSPTINLIISPTEYPTTIETTGTVLGESTEGTSAGKGSGKEFPIFLLLLGSGIMFLVAAVILGVKAKRNM